MASISMVLKKIVIFSMFGLLAMLANAQDLISIVGSVPYANGTMLSFQGYDGFTKMDLGQTKVSANAEIDFFTDYHGYCRMFIEGKDSWPVILEYDPTCLDWDNRFTFSCDPENEFFYKKLPGLVHIDSLITVLQKCQDSLLKIEYAQNVEVAMLDFKEALREGNTLNASIFLKAELLLRIAGTTDSLDQMTAVKADILKFIGENRDVLKHSDYMIRLAGAYIAMNDRSFQSQQTSDGASIYDVEQWLALLKPFMDERSIIDFFIMHFLNDGKVLLANSLVEKYQDIVKCPQFVSDKLRPANMAYTFNVFGGSDLAKVYSLEQFYGISKILVPYSNECPASIAGLCGLYDFVQEKQLRVPVILVPVGEPQDALDALLQKEAPFNLQTGAKTGSSLILGAGVKQLPAFIILDKNNLLGEIHYNLAGLKKDFSGE